MAHLGVLSIAIIPGNLGTNRITGRSFPGTPGPCKSTNQDFGAPGYVGPGCAETMPWKAQGNYL